MDTIRLLALLGIGLICFAADKADGTYIATAYSIEGDTKSGKAVKKGMVAADVDLLPLGTRIQVSGAGRYSGAYTVEDTGRKVSGREIDIYVENDAEAKKFGKKRVRVKVLSRPAAK